MAREIPPDDVLADDEGEVIALAQLGTPRARGGLRFTFASLAYRQFTLLWLGQITHAGALWVEQVARPLLILELTGSGIQLGLIMAVRTGTSVTFGLMAGVVADNFDRRLVLVVTKTIVLGLSAIFAAIVVFGDVQVWHIYLFTLLRGVTMAFDQPARRAMIPSVVPAHLVTNAMALSTGSMQVMRIVGATSAGLMIASIGFGGAFVSIAVIYVLALLFTLLLRVPTHRRRGYQGMRQMGGDLLAGLRFAWRTPAIRGVLIIGLGYFAFGMSFIQVFGPLFAIQVLDVGEAGFGFMMAMTGLGGVFGALTLATVNPSAGRGVIMLASLAALGIVLVLFSASTYLDTVVLAYALVVLVGFGQSVMLPLVNTSLVDAAPEDMRGRMFGLLSMDRAMTAAGGTVAGFLAVAIGTQLALMVFGAACVLTALVMFGSYPALRRIK